YDEVGHAIAVVKEARFRSVRLRADAVDHLRFLDYRLTPSPHPLAPAQDSAIRGSAVWDALTAAMLQCAEHPDTQRYAAEVEPLLDSLCSQFALEAFRYLAEKPDGSTADTETGTAHFGAGTPVAGYLQAWLQDAEQDRWLTRTPVAWILTDHAPRDIAAADIWNSLIADYPEYFSLIQAVGRRGLHLPAMQATADGREDSAAPFSFAALWHTGFGAANRRILQAAFNRLALDGLRDLPDGERLGLLEIGEGIAVWTDGLCAQLDFNRADAVFASTSAAAAEQAGLLQEDYPRLVVRQIDIAVQTFGQDAADHELPAISLAIVNLDFNTVEAAVLALRYAYAQLLAGGTVVLVGQHPARWMDFVADGAAAYSSRYSLQFWQEQLQSLGYVDATGVESLSETLAGAYVLAAQKPVPQSPAESQSGAATSRKWLILTDAADYSVRLTQALESRFERRGDEFRIEPAGDTQYLTGLLQSVETQWDGIIYQAGFKPLLADTLAATANPAVLVEQQAQRCAQVASLVQACETVGLQTTCWLLTAGVGLGMLPRQSISTAVVADAALWGFGRTVMNEAGRYAVRMVDFAAPEDIGIVAASLERELVQTDDEAEVLFGADGTRYAPRLLIEPRPANVGAISVDAGLRLSFDTPGQLRHLYWNKHSYVAPKDDEIEVDVHATGLNFRDVMYALGMLSDEAVENGFAGPSLGLEFAGVVSRVGKSVTAYAAGDRVVGFGPSSFSNRVLTRDSAIARIPKALSFEAAATIPSVFLTVYYALHHLAQLQPGERILIHGGAGGVGIAAIRFAQHLGAEIYATAGSESKRDFLRLLGVRHIYDSRSLAYADEILADTAGSGVDVVLNSLAGEAVRRNFQVLKPFGRFLELGKRDFYENTQIGLRPFRNNISYFGIDADQLMQIRPALTRRLFAEVIALFETGVLYPLPYTVFEANQIVDAFRHMQQARQIGKIVVTYHQAIRHAHTVSRDDAPVLQLNADATYLVTGGLSGFGLKTAEWLAAKGARHLVLISRSGPQSAEAKEALARLRLQGVTCHAAACDVTDRAALSALLQQIAATMPPLKGIVHAAMVIADGLVRNMDLEQIRRVLLPKVLGAYHLHQLTADCALDYFILFSSATTLFGNPGQGSYVAANAALEALARTRRVDGLAATCVRWGAIDDVGFLARNQSIKDALQNRMGGGALHSDVALDALESMLLADRSGLGVLELDWKALARFLPNADAAKFSEMARQQFGAEVEIEHDNDIQRMLHELSGEALHTAVVDVMRQEVGEILRIGPDKIDPKRSIYDMGLDSLMGVELVLALESRFGIRLSVMALSESPTIARLAERIIELLTSRTTPEESDAVALQVTQVAAQHGTVLTTESAAEMVLSVQDNSRGNNKRMIQRTAADPHVF
ncbi:MAG: SDR family NAD(P)-dependent oxidoreductase, partial [Burkholderiales bacterium]